MSAILIVDDDATGAESLAVLLGQGGHDAEWQTTADGVVERVGRGDLAAAIIDHCLPGEDGMTLLRKVRAGGQALPVLIWSATSSPQFAELERELEALQPAAAIRKPAQPDRILLLLGSLIGRAGASKTNN